MGVLASIYGDVYAALAVITDADVASSHEKQLYDHGAAIKFCDGGERWEEDDAYHVALQGANRP